ncbi:MAG TPA: hypothetical protein VIA11_18725 [Acidimicrobiia bacterium]|jgi:hypothetical protein|nr:hypothetical protein [Acidimicrobiia bacterium]
MTTSSPSSGPTADRDLFLHEFIDINGMYQWDYMEHTRQQSGDEKVDFELLGTWYTMGITARWPQVVNIWEIPGGWDGWYGKVDRLGLKRATNVTLNAWWKQAFEYRSGGFDRLLAAAPGCPTMASLAADDVRGSLFVHELSEVRPGAALDYLAAVREERVPLLEEYGHRLVGLYEVMMNDYEVCTVWATDADAHVRAAKARDIARGLARPSEGVDGDDRFEAWHAHARTWCTRWREELMTPHVGTLCAPAEAPLDDSAGA